MPLEPDPHGRQAPRPVAIPLRGWWAVIKRAVRHTSRDALSVLAAGCAFFALFALVPALTATVSLYAFIADPADVARHVAALEDLLPPQAHGLVTEQATRIVERASRMAGWGFLISLAIALWSANNVAKTLFTALNIAYEEAEKRSFIRFNLVTIGFTLAGIIGAIVVMATLLWLPLLFALVGLSQVLEWALWLGRWPLLAAMIVFGLGLIYAYGPSRRTAKVRWLTPGALFATIAWLAVTLLFSLYVENFADYDAAYGSLGAVIVLMFWLYLSFMIVLFGAELNASLELQTSHDTTVGPPKPMGRRGAYVADHVADDGPASDEAEISDRRAAAPSPP